MSELSDAISEMRNMRESYDQLAGAAEAYNEGKPALAEAITAKGVEAAATDSLAQMAEKVMTISQDTYEIDGGEMYAKQLFGSLDTPNYWNLYDILAQLLSDGRLVSYGGILLAEYYKGYDSLALSGAGAGGAYVVSDKDENGQFKMYTEDTTHTWATEFDGKGNRWVAYCFADEYHDFQITDTNTSPRSIFIGRKVGTITSLVAGRVSQIVVPDGNELKNFNTQTYTQNWNKDTNLKVSDAAGTLLYAPRSEQLYIAVKDSIAYNAALIASADADLSLKSIIMELPEVVEGNSIKLISSAYGNDRFKQLVIFVIKGKIIRDCFLYNCYGPSSNPALCSLYFDGVESLQFKNERELLFCIGFIKKIYLPDIESITGDMFAGSKNLEYIYVGYKTNDKTKSIRIGRRNNTTRMTTITDIELKNGYCKSINVASATQELTEANMYAHILQRLKQDEPDCGDGVTIALGATNLAKLTSEESVQLLDDLTNTYGYTFA